MANDRDVRAGLSREHGFTFRTTRCSSARGLFLDRPALLLSYDPTIDHDGKILERTLAAPVGAGINLEYYFRTSTTSATARASSSRTT